MQYDPEPNSDEDSDLDDEDDVRTQDEDDLDNDDDEFSERGPSGKRRSLGDGGRSQEKRRKVDDVSDFT